MFKLFKKKEVQVQKPKSIFMGRKIRKYWDLAEHYDGWRLDEKTETLERVKVLEKEMNFELHNGEEVYLEEIGKYTKIDKKTKDTNGNIIYNITYVAETVYEHNEDMKLEYEKLEIEHKIKKVKLDEEYELRKIEEQLQKQKEQEEYEKYCEEKKLVIKKGIIIEKIPMGKDRMNDFLIDLDLVHVFHRVVNEKFIDYDVIAIPMDVEIFNYDINGNLIGTNDEGVLFKN